MNTRLPARGPLWATALLILLLVPARVHADVTRVVLTSCSEVLGGRSFGQVGAYEKCVGKVYFALAPGSPRNRIIADLDKAPRNAQGEVEFSSDIFVLRPKDPSRGNGVLLFDVVNRGNKLVLPRFNLAQGAVDPTGDMDFGDGFLMREGYTVVAVGWEASPGTRAVALYPPVATEGGRPIRGEISNWFVPVTLSETFDLTSSYWTGFEEYAPLDPEGPRYELTHRIGYHGAQRVLPRDSWSFGRIVDGRVVYDPRHITLGTGFQPGHTYRLTYETQNPLVIGVGFAAIRDVASYFKFDPDAEVRGEYAYAYGVSQTGRYLRQLIHEGFTVDESGERRALDGVFVHAGGASLGSFNESFGQPNEGGFHSQTRFPLLYEVTRDPETGRRDGLGARIPPRLHPKVMFYETSSEYWDRGRVAALNHTSIDGRTDVVLPDNVRFYMMASIPHSNGSFPPVVRSDLQERQHPIDVRPSMRALLVGLDHWVREDAVPPASRYPTLERGHLVKPADLVFPAIPGVQWPRSVPGGYRSDLPGPLLDHPLPFLVSDVDLDGNELGGVILPEVAVPLATYAGWAFRSEEAGEPEEIMPMAGSYIPFARNRAERSDWSDPRLSVEERYSGRDDYLTRFAEATRRLVEEGYLLELDIGRIVAGAEEHWDWLMAQPAGALNP